MFENVDEFLAFISSGTPEGAMGTGTLNWAHGVVFRFYPLAATDSLTKEYIEGNLIWDHLEFAPMPDYVKEVKVPGKPLITFTITDSTKNMLQGQLGEWLQKTYIKKTK